MTAAAPSDRLQTAPALRKSRVCGTLDIVLLVALGLAVLVHMAQLSRLDGDAAAVFLRALAFATLMAAVPVSILWFLDRRERENPWMLAAAFLWGGLISTAASLPINTAFFRAVDRWLALHPAVAELLGPDAVTLIAAPLSGPIVEETMKAAGVVLILWMLRREFDGMRDGFVYGAMVGVGFNWFEAPLYVMQGYAQTGIPPYSLQLGLRHGLLGLGGHALFTGMFGLFLGLAAQTSSIWLKILAPFVGWLLAVLAHLINNALPLLRALAEGAADPSVEQSAERDVIQNVGLLEAMLYGTIPQLTILLPFTLIVLIALWRSGVWERRVIREEMASEVGRSITPGEYQAIAADRVLRTRRIDEFRPRHSAALVNAQHELAFRKRRVRDEGGDPETDPLVASWRQDIARLRAWRKFASK